MSITALGGDQLGAAPADRLSRSGPRKSQALSLQTSDPAFSRLILRGQNVGSVGATIATTVDDIPFFMSGAQADGAFFSANVDTYDLQRIEVLRGPKEPCMAPQLKAALSNTSPTRRTLKVRGRGSRWADRPSKTASRRNLKGFINLPFWDNKAALRERGPESIAPGWVDNPQLGDSDINGGPATASRLVAGPADCDFSARFSVSSSTFWFMAPMPCRSLVPRLDPPDAAAQSFDRVDGFVNNNPVPDEKKAIRSSMAH